jgi:hypothetical protein
LKAKKRAKIVSQINLEIDPGITDQEFETLVSLLLSKVKTRDTDVINLVIKLKKVDMEKDQLSKLEKARLLIQEFFAKVAAEYLKSLSR